MTDPQSPVDPAQQPDAAAAGTDVPPAADAPAAPAADAPPAAAPAADAAPAAAPPAPPAYDAAPPAAPAYDAAPPAPPAYDAAPPAYGAAPAAAPAYSAAPPAPYGAPVAAPVPGKTLGIVALVVVFFASLIGLILGYVARSQSKKAGVKNTPAKVAIILGWIFLVLSIIATILIIVLVVNGAGALQQLCEGMPPGEYPLTTGGTITCP
jgi:hypothetical protein